MKHIWLFGLLSLAAIAQSAHACTDPIWAKCPDGECDLRADNDPDTLAAALAVAQQDDACLNGSVAIYRVTQNPNGGYTEIDHYFSVNSVPVTSTSQLSDDGFEVSHDQTLIPPHSGNGVDWGLVAIELGYWIYTPCAWPCFD